MSRLASIDIGSYTARLLVAEGGDGTRLRPIARRRAYIRLADGFNRGGLEVSKEAIDRTLTVIKAFKDLAEELHAERILAVSTGITRKAGNRDLFIERISQHTGILVHILSGEEEARLTGKGALYSLQCPAGHFMVFDLGGGSTEFLFGNPERPRALSLPLGASVLTQGFFPSDPPEEKNREDLRSYIKAVLTAGFEGGICPPGQGTARLIGTGGTVTTLAAMLRGVDPASIGPESLEGIRLDWGQIEGLFNTMKAMPLDRRVTLKGLDRDRADVILAGTMAVIEILRFFDRQEVTVCLSDLLEGLLLDYFSAGTGVYNRSGPFPSG